MIINCTSNYYVVYLFPTICNDISINYQISMYVCMTVFPGSKFFLLLAKTSGGLNYFCFIKLLCVLSPFSCVHLFATPWTHQAPLSMGFSRREYWSGLPCPPPGDLPDPRIEPGSPALQADSLPLSH